jgi:hypothetical protein
MVARKVLTVDWLCEEQQNPKLCFWISKWFHMTAKIANYYATAKQVLDSSRSGLAYKDEIRIKN